MSGPPRLQVLAGGAFLSQARGLTLNSSASWTSVETTRARNAGSGRLRRVRPGAPRQPPKPRGSAASLGCRSPPAALPHPRPGRGARAGRSGASGGRAPPEPRPGARGAHAERSTRTGLLGKGLREAAASFRDCMGRGNYSTSSTEKRRLLSSSVHCTSNEPSL